MVARSAISDFPLGTILAAVLNNFFYSSNQVNIGRAFDLITTPAGRRRRCWASPLTIFGYAVAGLTG